MVCGAGLKKVVEEIAKCQSKHNFSTGMGTPHNARGDPYYRVKRLKMQAQPPSKDVPRLVRRPYAFG